MSSSRSPIPSSLQRLPNFLQLLQVLLGSTISVSLTITFQSVKDPYSFPSFYSTKSLNTSYYSIASSSSAFFHRPLSFFTCLTPCSLLLAYRDWISPSRSPVPPVYRSSPFLLHFFQTTKSPNIFQSTHSFNICYLLSYPLLCVYTTTSIFSNQLQSPFQFIWDPYSVPLKPSSLKRLPFLFRLSIHLQSKEALLLLPLHYFKNFFCYLSPSRLTPYFLLLPPYHQMADIMSSYALSRPFSLQTFTIQSSRYRWSLCHTSFPVYIGFLT